MAGPERATADPERQAEALINRVIDEEVDGSASSPELLQEKVRDSARHVSADVRHHIDVYLRGTREATEGTKIEELDEGIGGLYNGSERKIAKDTMEVSGGIRRTVDQIQETGKHEAYHALNKHLVPMETAATEDDRADLQIDGVPFSQKEIIEGLTVHDTGNTFVSDEYRDQERKLVRAASSAGIGMETVREAVNEKKDLTLIDDRTRQEDAAEPQYALAA